MRQYNRLKGVIADAQSKGAVIHTVTEQAQDDVNHRMTPHLLTEVNDDMVAMQEELFGPVLPIVPYDSIEEAISYITTRERPLALYLMSHDKKTQNRFYRKLTQAAFVSMTLWCMWQRKTHRLVVLALQAWDTTTVLKASRHLAMQKPC